MIHPLVKIITVDGFYTIEQATTLVAATFNLQYTPNEFGSQVDNFNMLAPDFSETISAIIGADLVADEDSGVFRLPQNFIHFEGFDSTNEWVFVVALQQSTFNVFEHKSGAVTALQGHAHNYRDLFEWDLKINYVLEPGQGVLFRPWLFHSFNSGQIQVFRLREKGKQDEN